MGGHGHGHHEPYTIPDYRKYTIEGKPELEATQRALAAQGLKDPWLRNEAWRFDRKVYGTEGSRARLLFLRGFRTGFIAFVATVIGTKAYEQLYPSEHHGHGDHH